jgi:bifunctional non-homologous end joining protein LigD
MAEVRDYAKKRSFEETPEPPPEVAGDVDPTKAPPGETFVIHQHHATRLHYDLRLEMLNGKTPVLVSWAVPKNLPIKAGRPNLAVHVEDHPFDYGSFSGTIPKGNYGAGEVRIFDSGTYEMLEQEPGKITFRLNGGRMQGVWHLFRPKASNDKDWLVRLRSWEGPEPDPIPDLRPMMATLVDKPFDNENWIFEPKWDGVRALAICQRDGTALLSRNQNDITASYPEFEKLHDRLVCNDAIVDGEIVAMEAGRPSFERLQSRINLQNERDIKRMMNEIPATFIAFDLLYLDGRSLLKEPIERRKELLEELVVIHERVQVSPYTECDGINLFETARRMQLEGIVGKKLGCGYKPGKRVREWVKVKTIYDADVVIGGWTPGEGSRSSTFGALLAGAYEDGELRFVGSVGTGFSEKVLDQLVPQLESRRTDECPFVVDPRRTPGNRFGKVIKNPRWVRPELVARVEFRELTSVGKLRAPSFKGLNAEKEAPECAFEDLAPKPIG